MVEARRMLHLADCRGAWIIEQRTRGEASAVALRRSIVRDSMARVEGVEIVVQDTRAVEDDGKLELSLSVWDACLGSPVE